MHLSKSLSESYTSDTLTARDAQRLAQFIAWGPAIFQASRAMLKYGILDMLRDAGEEGMEASEIALRSGLSGYAVTVLLEASLSIGIIIVNPDTDRFSLTKAGWFLLTDPSVKVNIDFNHDVNYIGWHRLDEALEKGYPAGLQHFGQWPTVYEALASLPDDVRRSWLAFDHFYSDQSFAGALEIVFSRPTRRLLDVGGNTGRWASECVAYDPDVKVTIVDLPGQLEMMRKATGNVPGHERIDGYSMNILEETNQFPQSAWDAIWMSQFLDCFSEEQIVGILRRAARVMGPDSRLYIMETLWDRQRFEPAALCLTMTSLYFTALANGNSRMYHGDVLCSLVEKAGMEVEKIHDNLGHGHSIVVCKKK